MRACCRSAVTFTRVIVMNPTPGSCTLRASSTVISSRIWSATRSGREWLISALQAARDLLHREGLDDVAGLLVVEISKRDAALEALRDFRDVVLEALERR